jgi:hypothetical protein
MDNRHIKVVHMKIVVSLLLFGIFSLPFLHDHRVLQAEAGYGAQGPEQSGLVRHVHLAENSSHVPQPESGEHQNQDLWPILDHVSLITLNSGSSTNLFTILPIVDASPNDYPSPDLPQSLWEPTSPVRGSPLNTFNSVLPSTSLLLPIHSGRAPPLFPL